MFNKPARLKPVPATPATAVAPVVTVNAAMAAAVNVLIFLNKFFLIISVNPPCI